MIGCMYCRPVSRGKICQTTLWGVLSRETRFSKLAICSRYFSSWSETCNLPQTSMPLRHKVSNELQIQSDNPEFLNLNNRMHGSRLDRTQGVNGEQQTCVVLHDGPPYANGKLHMGHAFQPGWDCHGMPIEHKVLKKYLKNQEKRPLPSSEDWPLVVRDESRSLAAECIETQKSGFKRWGIRANWEDPYFTYDIDYVSNEMQLFWKLFQKGLIYRGERPVYFSPSSNSVLADSEIEYENITNTAVYVKFPLTQIPRHWQNIVTDLDKSGIYVMIWTTQPWTLLANAAVAFNPEGSYSLVSDGERSKFLYLLDKSAVDKVQQVVEDANVVAGVDVGDFSTLQYEFYNWENEGSSNVEPRRLYPADFVTDKVGTGFVHIAPCHGEEDYNLAKEMNINFTTAVDATGVFQCNVPELNGKPALSSGNEACVDLMEEHGFLFHREKVTHSYPCDWRTKKPVMTILSKQWFIDVSKFIHQAIESLNQVTFIPSNARETFKKMLAQRNSWCISRQRFWGVPLPVFYDQDGEVVLDDVILRHLIGLFREKGVNSWFSLTSDQLLPDSYKTRGLTKGEDILDVWFDSGISWHTFAAEESQKVFYVEGRDQIRGWFQSSISTAYALNQRPPFTHIYTHGFVLDHRNTKMSKSVGNVIDPSSIVEKHGADVLRLWVALADTTSDIAYSERILDKTLSAYKKLRSVLRILNANLYDFPSDLPRGLRMKPIDLYMTINCPEVVSKCENSMENFSFHIASHELLNFVADDVSAFYLGSIKDRLYCDAAESEKRRSAQICIAFLLYKLLRPLEIFVPHLIHETRSFSNLDATKVSKLMKLSQRVLEDPIADKITPLFRHLGKVSDSVNLSVDNAKELARSDVMFTVLKNSEIGLLLSNVGLSEEDLTETLHCKSVTLKLVNDFTQFKGREVFRGTDVPTIDDVRISIARNESAQLCPRCRRYTSSHSDSLCQRCDDVVSNQKGDASVKV